MEALDDGARHYHDFHHVHLGGISQIEQDQHQIDLMLYHLSIVHQIFFVCLAEVSKQYQNTQDLQNVDDFVALSIFDLEKFIEPLSFFCRVKGKCLLAEF